MFVFLFASIVSVTFAQECVFENFDLHDEFDGVSLNFTDVSSGWDIQVSPCGRAQCPPPNEFPPNGAEDAVALKSSFTYCANVVAADGGGVWAYANGENHNDGIKIDYTNGDACGFDNVHSLTTTYICDDEAPPIVASTDAGACHWNVVINSQTVCNGQGGLSGGWVFTIIVLTCITAYFLFGCLYMYRFKGTQLGPESTPNADFWRSLPGYVKDGVSFTMEKIRGDKYQQMGETGNDF